MEADEDGDNIDWKRGRHSGQIQETETLNSDGIGAARRETAQRRGRRTGDDANTEESRGGNAQAWRGGTRINAFMIPQPICFQRVPLLPPLV